MYPHSKQAEEIFPRPLAGDPDTAGNCVSTLKLRSKRDLLSRREVHSSPVEPNGRTRPEGVLCLDANKKSEKSSIVKASSQALVKPPTAPAVDLLGAQSGVSCRSEFYVFGDSLRIRSRVLSPSLEASG